MGCCAPVAMLVRLPRRMSRRSYLHVRHDEAVGESVLNKKTIQDYTKQFVIGGLLFFISRNTSQ